MSRLDEGVERLAGQLLDRCRVMSPPVNVDEVAQLLGLNYDVVAMDDRSSGVYYAEGDGRGRAVINARHHRLRQRFTKAHELAHHLVDTPVFRTAEGMPYLQLPSGYRGHDRHWLHDRFAAALLMPRAWVGDFIRDRGWRYEPARMVIECARIFDVSRGAAEVRLRELGHIQGGRA